MRKQFKCKNCGEEENYEINGSWFYIAHIFFFAFVFIASVDVGLDAGLLMGGLIPFGWKAIAAFASFALLLWTMKAAKLWLPDRLREGSLDFHRIVVKLK
jgi:hypothetical protein